MLIRCCVIIFCLSNVNTSGDSRHKVNNELIDEFSFWPSIHNAARNLRNRRSVQDQDPVDTVGVGQMEGMVGSHVLPSTLVSNVSSDVASSPAASNGKAVEDNSTPHVQSHVSEHSTAIESNKELPKEAVAPSTNAKVSGNVTTIANDTKITESSTKIITSNTTTANNIQDPISPINSVHNSTEGKSNLTILDNSTVRKEIDFNSPGVVKRGAIVFGGFALLAVAYFIFYRSKHKSNEANTMHSSIDANQFRYGVLQSEDRRDNLESSRIPLTMESDDDEDDDMEIFDLEEKKKSLSYVNLQLNDEDVVLGSAENKYDDRDNLLLDIEDGNVDTLINWSSSGSKSVL